MIILRYSEKVKILNKEAHISELGMFPKCNIKKKVQFALSPSNFSQICSPFSIYILGIFENNIWQSLKMKFPNTRQKD